MLVVVVIHIFIYITVYMSKKESVRMKVHVNCTVSPDLLTKAKARGFNLSECLEDGIVQALNRDNLVCPTCKTVAPKSAWAKWKLVCPSCKHAHIWRDLLRVGEHE